MKAFLLSIAFWVPTHAAAAEQLFALKGAELQNYGVQEVGTRSLDFLYGGVNTWTKTKSGYRCTFVDDGQPYSYCQIYLRTKSNLLINQFAMPLTSLGGEIFLLVNSDLNESISHAQLAKQARDFVITLDEVQKGLEESLFNVQRGTVFTKHGSCYSYELRFRADPATKRISKYWFEPVAARCP